MELFGGFVGTIIFFCILYFVVKAAVRNGIRAARGDQALEAERLPRVTCTTCGKAYDMDYPRCPYCRNKQE